MSEAGQSTPKINLGASLLRMAIGAALGGGAFWFYATQVREIRWADGVAISVALVCFLAGVRLFAESFNAAHLAKRMEVEGESTPKEAQGARLQAALFVALGVAMAWPIIATLNAWPAPLWSYGVTAVFIVIRLAYTVRMFQCADEFVRQRVRNATFWTYFVGQTALLAYASAERLGLAAPLSAWDVVVSFVALSILVPLFVGRAKTSA